MSENKTIINKTKSKKRVENFRFSLSSIDIDKISHSCEKLNNRNKNVKLNDDIKITSKKCVIRNIDDYEILPLININYIFSSWKSSNLLYDNFESIILNKNDFDVNYDTYVIRTKNEEAEKLLEDERFWILYIEFLIVNHKIKNGKQFLEIINMAFSKLEDNYKLLLIYYLEKIKRFNPIKKDGKIMVYKDNYYIDLLNPKVKTRIKDNKKFLTTEVKIKKHIFIENTPVIKKSKKE